MNFEFDFLPLFIVLAIAWIIPILTQRIPYFRFPTVILEIIAGFIIGDHVLGILPHEPYMEFLGLTGFVFLMFLSGLEIDVNKILGSLPRRKITTAEILYNPLFSGMLIYIGTLVMAFFSAYLLSFLVPITNLWYFSLIISTSSVGVILPVLKERGETNKRFGQMIILAAAVADVMSIFLFTFTTSLIKKGFEFEVLLILSLFVAFFVSYQIGKKLVKTGLFRRIILTLSHASSQIKVRGTLVLILLFIILSQMIDAEIILGAFMAGILMSFFNSKERSSLLMKLDAMGYGFFIPIFFIMVGSSIDLSALQHFDSSFLFLGILLLILFGIKVIPSMLWSRVAGTRQALAGGLLLSSRLSLIIAASQVGLQLGVITPAVNTSFIIMAIITCISSPLLFNQVRQSSTYDADLVIIIGGGGKGVILSKNLQMHGRPSIIIEHQKNKADRLLGSGFNVIHADGTDIEAYKALNLVPKNQIVILTGSEEQNVQIAHMLKNSLQHTKILTYGIKKSSIERFKHLDVESVDLTATLAIALENLIYRPETYHTVFESFQEYTVKEIPITNNRLNGEPIKNLSLHNEGFLMMIKKEGETIIPHGEDRLYMGDVAVVFGSDQAIDDYSQKFSQ